MSLPDVVLGSACLALVVFWVRAERAAQHLRVRLDAATADARRASALEGAVVNARLAVEQAQAALEDSDRERQAALAEAAEARRRADGVEERRRRLALLTDEERAALLATRCQYCGGSHPRYALSTVTPADQRACPRLRRLRLGPGGNVTEAEFREDWDQGEVIWPDEIAAFGAEAEATRRAAQRTDKERPITVISG